jgi:hypothetical protein
MPADRALVELHRLHRTIRRSHAALELAQLPLQLCPQLVQLFCREM